MKTLFVLILFLFVKNFVFSNLESQKDSLYRDLKVGSSNLTPKKLYEIAVFHDYLNEFTQSKNFSSRSLKLAKELKQNDIQVLNYCLIAEAYRRNNQLDRALQTILIAVKIDVSSKYEAESQRNLILARILAEMRAFKSSLQYLKKNQNIWIKKGNNLKKFHVMSDLGIAYLKLQQWNDALKCFKTGLYFKQKEWQQLHGANPQKNSSTNSETDLSNIHVYNNLGVIYSKINKLDAALYYYTQALQMANRIHDKNRWEWILFGYVKGNIGVILSKQGKYSEAFPYLMTDYTIIHKYGEPREKSNIKTGMAEEFYIPQNDFIKAETLLLSALKESKENTIQNNQLRALKLLSDLYLKKGEIKKSHDFLNKYISCRNLIDIQHEFIAGRASEELAKYKIGKVNDILKIQKIKANDKLNRFFIITVFSIISSVFFILFIIKRSKNQKKTLELSTVKNLLADVELKAKQSEIEFKNKEMEQFALNIIEKNEFLENIKKELKKISIEFSENQKLKEIYNSINQKLNIELSNQEFELKLDNAQQSFLLKLQTKHPDLTENDKRLCSLLLLKFSSKEIAGILNISVAGVNKSRQRLRKKMELDPQADFSQFFGN